MKSLFNNKKEINYKIEKIQTKQSFCKIHYQELSKLLKNCNYPSTLLVLASLHSYDYIYTNKISYKMIQRKTQLSTTTISKALKILQHLKIIEIKKTFNRPNQYKYLFSTTTAKEKDIIFIPTSLINQITTASYLNISECFSTLILFIHLRRIFKSVIPKKSFSLKKLAEKLNYDPRTIKKALNFLITFEWINNYEKEFKITKYESWNKIIIIIHVNSPLYSNKYLQFTDQYTRPPPLEKQNN